MHSSAPARACQAFLNLPLVALAGLGSAPEAREVQCKACGVLLEFTWTFFILTQCAPPHILSPASAGFWG